MRQAASLDGPTRNSRPAEAHSLLLRGWPNERGSVLGPDDAAFDMFKAPGTYLLLLGFQEPRVIVTKKKIGTVRVGPLAVYAGSARNGLAARLRWHWNLETKRKVFLQGTPLAWCIDYLTLFADRIEAIGRPEQFDECKLAQALLRIPGSESVPRFGSTNCVGRCISHLVLLPPEMVAAARALGEW